MARLMDKYRTEVVPALCKQFGKSNSLAVAKIQKVVINIGVGKDDDTEKRLEEGVRDLTVIAGQRPIQTVARASIAGFKLRKGEKIGLKVTLRGKRMYEFLDRLIATAVPRIRDFRGLSPTAFDKDGNYTMGLAEKTVFPEVNIDKVEYNQGMNITIVMTGKSKEESFELLRQLGMPFRVPGTEAAGG
jgi:large subunit ribosomal protein L5